MSAHVTVADPDLDLLASAAIRIDEEELAAAIAAFRERNPSLTVLRTSRKLSYETGMWRPTCTVCDRAVNLYSTVSRLTTATITPASARLVGVVVRSARAGNWSTTRSALKVTCLACADRIRGQRHEMIRAATRGLLRPAVSGTHDMLKQEMRDLVDRAHQQVELLTRDDGVAIAPGLGQPLPELQSLPEVSLHGSHSNHSSSSLVGTSKGRGAAAGRSAAAPTTDAVIAALEVLDRVGLFSDLCQPCREPMALRLADLTSRSRKRGKR